MFRSILCPVDFSEGSARTLRQALSIADADGAHLTLLHVTDPLLDAAARATGTEETITDQTQAELRKLLTEVSPAGVKGPLAVSVLIGDPAHEILSHARECSADLIVMGTQGRGAAERFLLGSTAAKVVRTTTIPVLVVPPERK